MKNYVGRANRIKATAPSGGITAGQGLLVGARIFGVALSTAAEGAEVVLARDGEFVLAKTSALAITRGDALYWDATNKVVNKTSTGQKEIGVANADAANPSATVSVILGVSTGPGA